jgi:hypothetical protein
MSFSILQALESAPKALTVKQVAAIFNRSEKVIYKLANTPAPAGMPCVRLGASITFDPLTLMYWVKKQDPRFELAKKQAQKEAA